MLTGTTVSVGTTPTLVYSADGAREVRLRVRGANQVFLGDSSVSVGTGYLVSPTTISVGDQDVIILRLNDDEVWAVAGGTADIDILAYTV